MLAIKKLDFNYEGTTTLFAKLNLELKSGSIHGLLGKNGAGKTTLLKIMAGLIFPCSGDCTVMGSEPRLRLPSLLQDIYFIPEEFYVPNVTVAEYVRLYAPFYLKFDNKILQRALHEFDLPNDKKLPILSYGQKKKFLVAFGLATNCSLLLLDEPTNGLDIPSKSQFRKLVASLLTTDKTFIISTHQVRDLENLIDNVIILDDGEIIFQQSLAKITQKLLFGREQDAPAVKNIIYKEQGLNGYVVSKNIDGFESHADFEVLFNAVLANKEKIRAIFAS